MSKTVDDTHAPSKESDCEPDVRNPLSDLWRELSDRLLTANPARYTRVFATLLKIVEAEEQLAGVAAELDGDAENPPILAETAPVQVRPGPGADSSLDLAAGSTQPVCVAEPARQREVALIMSEAAELQEQLGEVFHAAGRVMLGDTEYDSEAEASVALVEAWGRFLQSVATTMTFELGAEDAVWGRFVAARKKEWFESYCGPGLDPVADTPMRPEARSSMPWYLNPPAEVR